MPRATDDPLKGDLVGSAFLPVMLPSEKLHPYIAMSGRLSALSDRRYSINMASFLKLASQPDYTSSRSASGIEPPSSPS